MMRYQPITAVWEVTMGCNMRCGHCGSSCEAPLPDELTTEEALDLCEQIADLGLKWITLSGGEPLTRKDILSLVKALSGRGVVVNMITNGWLLTEEMVDGLKRSGISTVAISIDGTREIHNQIRKDQAYEHAEKSFALLKSRGIQAGAVTTITNQNIDILEEMKEELIRIGVDSWQVQLGLPMGNLKDKPDWLLSPEKVKDIIEFCYVTAKEGRIKIYPADCIGYYTRKELETKKFSYGTNRVAPWDGCNAGTRGFGILQNGEILGCTSIRDKSYIEGSIRQRKLRDIWEDKNSFRWRREMDREKLTGNCRVCTYGDKCLGGCPNTRLTMNGDIYSENQYCAYYQELENLKHKYESYTDAEQLFTIGDVLIRNGVYQEASYALKQLLSLEPEHVNGLLAKAYAEYRCGNYEQCRQDNEKVLSKDSENSGALSGYAHALFALGNRDEAISYMEKAAAKPGANQAEFIHDFYAMRKAVGR